MLGSLHRFHGYNSLNYLYKRGNSVRGAHMALRYNLNNRRHTYRAAVVVSRKVDKSAVVRNRIRRRVYEVVRRAAPEIQQPYDMAFTIFSNQVATIDSKVLERAVRQCLVKASIITSVKPPVRAIVNAKDTE